MQNLPLYYISPIILVIILRPNNFKLKPFGEISF